MLTMETRYRVAHDPLYGSGIRMNGAWVSHVSAASEVGFWTTARSLPSLAWFALRTSWRADRRALLSVGLAQVVQAAVSAFGLLAVNKVLIGLLAAGPTPERVRAAVPALMMVGLVLAVGSLMRALATAAQGRLSPKVQRSAEQRMLEHASRVELSVLEDGAFQRSLAGAKLGVTATQQLTSSVLSSAGALLSVAAMASAVSMLHPLLVPLLLLAVIPQAWKAVTTARWEYLSAMKWMNRSRQKSVLAEVLTAQGAPAEEIRVHGLADFLLSHYRRLAGALEDERSRLAKAQAMVGVFADAAGGIARVLTYVALGWLLVTGAVPLATAATAVIAITRVTGQLTSLLLQFNDLYTHGLFVADYTRTLDQAAAHAIAVDGQEASEHPSHISVRNVHFTYPGSDEPAVQGVDLDLRRGEIIALVGVNGSGKSTLARLLAGLHRPEVGTITWDGVEVSSLNRASLFSRVAWIGQDFHRWPFTARLNATLGRPGTENEEDRLAAAATFAEADEIVAALPDRWETLLARNFEGGVNLSGGQWQRMALARGHFRDAQILICDEPTAALDPITEIETFDKLMRLAGNGQTVVLITHRLGSIRYADRIYHLEGGRLTEAGTYDQLMALGGSFARMYQAQRHQYSLPSQDVSRQESQA
ncbi:ABC transporter ATP-binding protein [Streptomyces sp. NPDC056069]|uniref:ABC transporter ATP-binding protein n=1 Tax=Streptomyces sp. NPDC056069 TaxID=3345702 RepID=UPI0035D91203